MRDPRSIISFLFACICLASASGAAGGTLRAVSVSGENGAPAGARTSADVFCRCLKARVPSLAVATDGKGCSSDVLRVVLAAPSKDLLPAEGYEVEVRTLSPTEVRAVVRGADRLGCLFALGAVYRRLQLADDGFEVSDFTERSSPCVKLRAVGQTFFKNLDVVVAKRTGARRWRRGEAAAYQEELALLGANAIHHGYGSRGSSVLLSTESFSPEVPAFCAERGLKYVYSCQANGLGIENLANAAWAADLYRTNQTSLACPSVPDARRAILRTREIMAERLPTLDSVMILPGDVGGCDCPRCRPWDETYYDLAAEIAAIFKHRRKGVRVFVSNQMFQADANRRFFTRYRQDGPGRFDGYVFGPCCDEGSFYGEIRPTPCYAGANSPQGFLSSRLPFLHVGDEVVAFVDIGHWRMSQTAKPDLDPAFSEIFPRRGFNVRPKRLGDYWRKVLPCATLAVGYSESMFDDYEKFHTLRLLWNPKTDDRTILREYGRMWCGENVADDFVEAAFLHERNVEEGLARSAAGIERCHRLLEDVASQMEAPYRRDNWRFAMFRQRAALDAFLSRRLVREKAAIAAVEREIAVTRLPVDGTTAERWRRELEGASKGGDLADLLRIAKDCDGTMDAAAGLKADELWRWHRLPDQSGSGWLKARLTRLCDAEAERVRDEILNYDRVGPDEFYDDCGNAGRMPHFDRTSGEVYYGAGRLTSDSRPSERSYCFSTAACGGLRFAYEGLDRTAAYEVAFTAPNPVRTSFALNSPNAYEVTTDGRTLARIVPDRTDRTTHHAFPVPREVTSDGRLELRFVPSSEGGHSTSVSEIWLRKVRGQP